MSKCRERRCGALVAFFQGHPDSLERLRKIRNGPGAFSDRVGDEFGYRPSADECNALSLVVPGNPDRLMAARSNNAAALRQRVDAKENVRKIEAKAARKSAAEGEITYRKLAERTVAVADPMAIADLAARNVRFAAEIGIVVSVEAEAAPPDGSPAVRWHPAGRTLSIRLKKEVEDAYLRATGKVRNSPSLGSRASTGRRRSMLALEAERIQLLEEEEASAARNRAEERRPALAAKEVIRAAKKPELLQAALGARAKGARTLVDLIAGSRDVRALLTTGQGVELVLDAEEAALLAAEDERRRKRSKRRSGGSGR